MSSPELLLTSSKSSDLLRLDAHLCTTSKHTMTMSKWILQAEDVVVEGLMEAVEVAEVAEEAAEALAPAGACRRGAVGEVPEVAGEA